MLPQTRAAPLSRLAPRADAPTRYDLDTTRRTELLDQRRLEADLRRAAEGGQFLLHYQPRVRLGDGAAFGAEALIRWPHRRRGLVLPAAFIPLAERSDLVTRIGGWVLGAACAEAAGWTGRAGAAPVVSVNVSARQLQDGLLLRQVGEALAASGLTPERLELELTETLLVDDSDETLFGLCALRDLGIGLALDDFGAGYAGFGTLKRLPLTTLKLSRLLTRDAVSDAGDARIVRAMVETGHALGLAVVAEGIETEDQRDLLAALGCDEGQGWLLGRPVAAEDLRGQFA